MNLIQIENKAGQIKLNDIVMQPVMDRLIAEIGKIFGASAAASGDYTGELTNCAEASAIDTLEIVIHSPGGSVLDGYTLYNEIKQLRARGVHVTATVNSLAASMASVICMACDVVRIVPGGRMMIHDVSQGVRGNADALRKAAELCDSMSDEIAGIYADRTGKSIDQIRAMMKTETWLSAKEAVAAGFADEVFDIRPAEAKSVAMKLLKALFPGNEAEISQVEAALAEVDSLRNDISMLTSETATLKAELVEKDHAIAEAVAKISQLTESHEAISGELATANAALETAVAELAEKDKAIEAAKNSAGEEATQILAAIGQPEPIAATETTGQIDHLAVLGKLQGAERTAYYNENKAEIRKQLTKP